MDNDLYYLRAVSRRLEEMRDALDMEGEAVSLLGLEALSDELDWLEDFIARQENAAAEIERLTARLQAAEAEVKELRAVLRGIIDLGGTMGSLAYAQTVYRAAHAALGEGE